MPDLKLEGGEESEPTRAPAAASASATPADHDGMDPGPSTGVRRSRRRPSLRL